MSTVVKSDMTGISYSLPEKLEKHVQGKLEHVYHCSKVYPSVLTVSQKHCYLNVCLEICEKANANLTIIFEIITGDESCSRIYY